MVVEKSCSPPTLVFYSLLFFSLLFSSLLIGFLFFNLLLSRLLFLRLVASRLFPSLLYSFLFNVSRLVSSPLVSSKSKTKTNTVGPGGIEPPTWMYHPVGAPFVFLFVLSLFHLVFWIFEFSLSVFFLPSLFLIVFLLSLNFWYNISWTWRLSQSHCPGQLSPAKFGSSLARNNAQ